MSFVSTLAKVAMGVVIAKGVGSMIQKSQAGGTGAGSRAPTGGAGSGGLFGGAHSPGTGSTTPGNLDTMMRDILAGTPASRAGTAPARGTGGGAPDPMGGLGGLLEQLSRGSAGTRPASAGAGGGLDDLLGQLTKGGAGGGGLGDLLGGLLGGAAAGGMAGGASAGSTPRGTAPTKGFGELLNEAFANNGATSAPPAPAQEAAAALMLRAMIQATKADGKIDEAEKRKILDQLGDAGEAEMRFVKAELAAPVDIQGLARQVPKGLEGQVYAMSVMAITLDDRQEAEYLHQLAQALGIDPQSVNQIHAQLGVQPLYG